MQDPDSNQSLSERAYSITKSYHRINNALIWTIGFALALCFGLFAAGLLRLNRLIEGLNLTAVFDDVTFGIYFMFGAIVFVLGFTLILVALRGRKTYKDLKNWGGDYLLGAYVLNFSTSTPKGNTHGERIFSVARHVFPELQKIKETDELVTKDSLNRSFGSDSFDLALKTGSGYFIVKDFGEKTVTIQDVKALSRSVLRHFRRNKVFRVVMLSKNYDDVFVDYDKVEEEIKKLHLTIPIDVLIQDTKGYSVLHVASII